MTTKIGFGLAATVLVAFVVLFVMRRRRSAGAQGAADEDAAAPDRAGGSPFSDLTSSDDAQPSLGLSDVFDDSTTDGSGPQQVEAFGGAGEASFDSSADTVEIGVEDVADGGEDKEAEPVDSRRRGEQSMGLEETQIATGAGQPQVIGNVRAGAGDDVMRMIREFERRIASLETRLDESADARERLERQVAAQTEELRVQRAAIARTQRAVRNMNRPDDEGPTEPALREPQ
jgi:hypothetical protein